MTIGTLVSIRLNGSGNKDRVELEYSERTHTDSDVDGDLGLRVRRPHSHTVRSCDYFVTNLCVVYSSCISGIIKNRLARNCAF